MTAATLAIVAERPATHLSTARQALAEHCASIAELQAEVARASRPAERLRQQTRAANEQLAAAESDLAAIDAQHAAAIAKAAREGSTAPLPKAPARATLVEHIDEAKRTKAAVERALAECVADERVANAALRDAEAKVEPLLLGVLLEEFDSALQAWRQAHETFSAADNNMRGLLDALGARGRELAARQPEEGRVWLAERERMGAVCAKLPATPAGNFSINAAKWSALLPRLATDPHARPNS